VLRLTSILLATIFVCLAIFGNGDAQRRGLETANRTPAAATPPAPLIALTDVRAAATPETRTATPISLRDDFSPSTLVVPSVLNVAPVARPAPVEIVETVELAPLEETIESPLETITWVVSATRVNVRQGPSTRYSVMTKLSKGDAADVIEILDNGWAFIRTENGQRGYLSAQFLKKQEQQG